MKVSLKWLSDYVEVPQDIKEFCDRLDLTGTGVEGVERTGDVFDGVVSCCHHRRGAPRRLQDQEVEAARRCKLWHVLLSARAGHGQRT